MEARNLAELEAQLEACRREEKLSPRSGKPGGTAGRSRELRRRRQVRLAGRYALPPASCRVGRDRARLRRGPGTLAGGSGAGAQPAERATFFPQ